MSRVPLFNEYRLVERSETEINGVWKGAHLLLFFLAFVFGSFCTFCFHMLMYLFDEKCVLFPKLLSLTSLRHNVIYEFIPSSKDLADMPVDFLSTQWVEKSTCSLPTYVPLVSGIFGLVWTTMFLMCSTGSRTLSGLQRPWRVLPPVFLFSLAMGGLCIYSSAVTHYGLQELCLKLGEITGSSTCTYTVNVATLTYERRIRGVYQATRLTIVSAWLHTACWLLSALLALVRILLAVDFQLVCVHVQLHGDIEKILENDEVQIRTVSPDIWAGDSDTNFHNKPRLIFADYQDEMKTLYDDSEVSRRSQSVEGELSTISLVPEERKRLVLMEAFKSVDNAHKFIVRYLYDLLDALILPGKSREASAESTISRASDSSAGSRKLKMNRQYGQEHIVYEPLNSKASVDQASYISEDVEEIVKSESLQSVDRGAKPVEESYYIRGKVIFDEQPTTSKALEQPAEPEPQLKPEANLSVKIKDDLNKHDKKKKSKKSNLKTIGVQTSKDRKPKRNLRVKITEVERESEVESESDSDSTPDLKDDVDKETQTAPKEKQD